jgi:hypothetical protein
MNVSCAGTHGSSVMTTGIVTVGARKTTRGAVNAAAPEKGGGLSAFQRSASEGRFFFFSRPAKATLGVLAREQTGRRPRRHRLENWSARFSYGQTV